MNPTTATSLQVSDISPEQVSDFNRNEWPISSECADRVELDDAVLEMLGIKSAGERAEIIRRLYGVLREFFERTRQKEEKAIANKRVAKRRAPARAGDIATQIYEEIKLNYGILLRSYDLEFVDKNVAYDTFELPEVGSPSEHRTLFVEHGVEFVRGGKSIDVVEAKNAAQVPLILLVADNGLRGLVRIPRDEDECRRVLQRYGDFVLHRDRRVRELIAERTADEEMQEKVRKALLQLIVSGR